MSPFSAGNRLIFVLNVVGSYLFLHFCNYCRTVEPDGRRLLAWCWIYLLLCNNFFLCQGKHTRNHSILTNNYSNSFVINSKYLYMVNF